VKKIYCILLTAILCGVALSGTGVQAQMPQTDTAPLQHTAPLKVGFDLDDTLVFSTPAFNKGFGSRHKAFSRRFWRLVNKSDNGNSRVKEAARAILGNHRKNGDTDYIITARRPYGAKALYGYIEKTFKISKDRVFFEPNGKTKRIKALSLDIFYGDSDSDMSAAIKAGAMGIRIRRSPDSWHKKKYHPGKFNEQIIERSENHLPRP
jgi:acid phosphatase (class B)